jgi:hypothetical protein
MIADAVSKRLETHFACHSFNADQIRRLQGLADVSSVVSKTATKMTVMAVIGFVLTCLAAGIYMRFRGN